ncbi:cytochrome o ubiquinol oxidase subunit III [Agrobacterium rosae]
MTADPARDKGRDYFTLSDHHPEDGTLLGFWVYLMSDSLLFAALFATHAVLGQNYAGGSQPAALFSLPLVAINTGVLLVSSITYGFAMIASEENKPNRMSGYLAVTACLGVTFVALEMLEFTELIVEGAGPGRSGFLSSFFVLVGTHGLHVTFGIIWIAVLIVQVRRYGLNEDNRRRLMCLSLFWHFLDVIWIGVFTFVYLMGVLR